MTVGLREGVQANTFTVTFSYPSQTPDESVISVRDLTVEACYIPGTYTARRSKSNVELG